MSGKKSWGRTVHVTRRDEAGSSANDGVGGERLYYTSVEIQEVKLLTDLASKGRAMHSGIYLDTATTRQDTTPNATPRHDQRRDGSYILVSIM